MPARPQRMWTMAERSRARSWRVAGMSIEEIARLLHRSYSSVHHKVKRFTPQARGQPPGSEHERAKAALALEIVRARAEAPQVPLYRRWPSGLWQ